MKSTTILVIFILFTFGFFGCTDSKLSEPNEIIELDYNQDKDISESLTTQLFQNRKLIKLETTEESVFSNINRLIIFEDKHFIFDLDTESVLIFDKMGSLISKIKPTGRGPGEYIQLSDISIDPQSKQLVLLCAIPQILIYYDLNGQYIKHEAMPEFNRSFSIGYHSMFFIRYLTEENTNFIGIYANGRFKEFLPIEDYIRERMVYSPYPDIIRSDNIYFTKVFDSNVYYITEDNVTPKYGISLGSKSINLNLIKRSNLRDIQRLSFEQGLIYRISNFRESDKYLTFSTYPFSRLVIYDKQERQASLYSKFHDPEIGLYLNSSMHIAHDGVGNDLVFIVPAELFNKNITRYLNEYDIDDVLGMYQETAKELNDTDNPVLIIYTLP